GRRAGRPAPRARHRRGGRAKRALPRLPAQRLVPARPLVTRMVGLRARRTQPLSSPRPAADAKHEGAYHEQQNHKTRRNAGTGERHTFRRAEQRIHPKRTARARANANGAILRAVRSRDRRVAHLLPQRRRRAQRHPRTSRVSAWLGASPATESRTVPMKAIWRGQVIAESDRTLEVEGYRYFPRET